MFRIVLKRQHKGVDTESAFLGVVDLFNPVKNSDAGNQHVDDVAFDKVAHVDDELGNSRQGGVQAGEHLHENWNDEHQNDDEDEDDEEENEASSESESDSDEKSTPGFGFAFAVAGTLAGARLIRSKIH